MLRRHRLPLLALGLSLCFAAAAQAEENTLTDKEKAEGWKLLFDGKSTKGWRNYQKETVGGGWKVENGELIRAEKDAGDIITVDQYGAFELSLDYKIEPGGNSGLMYHVQESEKKPWQTGPEVQIQDNKAGHDPQKAGWLYQFYSSDKDATKPAGEWNTLRILITPEKCEHTMNGVKYFDYVKGSDDWKARYEKSKFKAFANFGKPTSGHICLQDHNNLVSFRNIKIRDLSKDVKVAEAKPTEKTVKAEAKAVETPDAKPDAKAAKKPKVDKPKDAKPAEKPDAKVDGEASTSTPNVNRAVRRSNQVFRRLRALFN